MGDQKQKKENLTRDMDGSGDGAGNMKACRLFIRDATVGQWTMGYFW